MIDMALKITPAAVAKIKDKMTPGQKILLDLDDGVGPFSNVGYCSLDTSFRLLLVPADADIKDYPDEFESNLGAVYYKDYAAGYFDEHEVLDVNEKNQMLTLSNNSGLIDGHISIVVFENESMTH
ncbi:MULTISPECIES: iron-sulfur cluster biosynthesis family protein [Latilactobacillus]|nr:iron-sulfur cluster biosynthesis family protein [Latilactobacillus curvatus]